MAILYPTFARRPPSSAGDHAEQAVLTALCDVLPDVYALFHNVDWSRGEGVREQHGEVDIVVVNQAGETLLIEVKAGDVEFRSDGIFKRYGAETRNVTRQAGLQYGALRGRLHDAGLPSQLHHLLVLPDVRVGSETVMWPRERIVDSADLSGLPARVMQLLGPGVNDEATQRKVLAFFENRFRIEPDVSALAGRVTHSSTRLASGLATWVPRICAPSGVIRIAGTAGSGKTQLALGMLRKADVDGQKAAYVCFNRALADHMACLAPVRTSVETFHEYALCIARQTEFSAELKEAGAFDALASHCMEFLSTSAPDLDLLVLDEMQDFQPGWVQALLGRLRPDARALLLEDPEQQLYVDREAFDIPQAVLISSQENYRSPRVLVQLVNSLRLTDVPIEPMGVYEGSFSDPIVYATAERIAPCTVGLPRLS